MAFGGLEKKQAAAPMADINMTPLIDVMLVLLVIFIITAPLFTHAIRLDLPKVAAAPARQTPQTISLSIDAAGKLYWNGEPITLEQMRTRFAQAAKRAATQAATQTQTQTNTQGGQQPGATAQSSSPDASDQPEIQLRAERGTRYEVIAQVMGAAQQAGLERIGFVTDPPPPRDGMPQRPAP
ncbi:biopolymer transporter ExbD [Paraburkholderia sp. D15]|uniref:ExbD/TolR family protein n=1 Tax=Paraburkholderia sp. D15 TaxID=2880218 RepID=UPI00247AB81C|nr:biopolymer transporter ExbD [Paraburkholderia sp. D15]WGS49375.1 biopolymer transporter ExbD [Paraburkholderia sp. D15]